MKYKIGDKVIIKTWEKMKEEYGLWKNERISLFTNEKALYIEVQEKYLTKLNNGRVLTIDGYGPYEDTDNYTVEEFEKIKWVITNEVIECLYIKPEPINDRFEILDL